MVGYITDFAVRPVRAEYAVGQYVVFSGRLLYGYGWKVPGHRLVSIMSNGALAGQGYTDSESKFNIPVLLPFSPGTFVYRAYVQGCEWFWHAWWPCHIEDQLTDPIEVVTSTTAPPQAPSLPPLTGITAVQSYNNYDMAPGSEHFMGCFLGELREDGFYVPVIEYEGVQFAYGSIVGFQAGETGVATLDVPTYTLDVPGLWDSLAWVGSFWGTLNVLLMDDRVIGIKTEDLGRLIFYDTATFKEVLEIVGG